MNIRSLILGISAFAVVAAVATWTYLALQRPAEKPLVANELTPATRAAVDRFHDRGGKYIWGENDCSVFVLDFLKASGVPIKRRLTTKELYDLKIMAEHGYVAESAPAKVGDIVVFRYLAPRPAGHCGVVVEQGGEVKILHNAASMHGLVLETVDEFLIRAEQFGAPRESVRLFRAKGPEKT